MKNALRRFIKRLMRLVQKLRILYYALLSSDVRIEGTLRKNQPLLIAGKGRIIVNGHATIGYFPSPFFFNGYAHFDLRKDNARIEIGHNVVFNNNTSLIADDAVISIGNETLIGLNCTVMTSDAHCLKPSKRKSADFPRENIRIGDNVFIGNNVTILKGVTIGDNSVIGTGSIVIHNIPENVIAAGIPCKPLRTLNVE